MPTVVVPITDEQKIRNLINHGGRGLHGKQPVVMPVLNRKAYGVAFNADTMPEVAYYLLTSCPFTTTAATNQVPVPRLIAIKSICVRVKILVHRPTVEGNDIEVFDAAEVEHVMPLSHFIPPDYATVLSRNDYIRTSIHTVFVPKGVRGDMQQMWYYNVNKSDLTRIEQMILPVVVEPMEAIAQPEIPIPNDAMQVIADNVADVQDDGQEDNEQEVEGAVEYECAACRKTVKGAEIANMQACPNECGDFWICSNAETTFNSCLYKQLEHSRSRVTCSNHYDG